MRRATALLAVATAVACVPAAGASAYVVPGGTKVAVSTFGLQLARGTTLDIQAGGVLGAPDTGANGKIAFSRTNATGLHQYDGAVECLHVDAAGRNATLLARVTQSTGEPATLSGVLIHVTDAESPELEGEGNDQIDVASLDAAQYAHRLAGGCAATRPATTQVWQGNITVVTGG
jgi:hypothetical protein